MDPSQSFVRLKTCVVDLNQGLVERNGTSVALTAQEHELLVFLVRHPEEVFSRDHLLREVWGQKNPGLTRAVDMTVRRLRKKIEANSRRPDHLRTVRSEGYRFIVDCGPVSVSSASKSSSPISTLAGPRIELGDLDGALPMPFGRYILLDLLGEGGFARVYRAELKGPSGFRKTVAVKVMKEANAARAAELEHEGRLGGLLKHRNVVDTYELGVVEGRGFVAMEWVDGLSLRELLGTATPPPNVALSVGLDICRGLSYAHGLHVDVGSLGLVHLDLKPGNVLVGWDGAVKVADFGIARLTQVVSEDATRSMGTPAYMSPEQALGQPLDARADVYSLGALLYELTTGERLFRGTSRMSSSGRLAYVSEVVARDEAFTAAENRIRGIGAVLRACLAISVKDRTPNVERVAVALRQLQDEVDSGPSLELWLAEALESRERSVVASVENWVRVTPAAEETVSLDVLDSSDAPSDIDTLGARLGQLRHSEGLTEIASALHRVEESMASLTSSQRHGGKEELEQTLTKLRLTRVVEGNLPALVFDVAQGVCVVGGQDEVRHGPNSTAARLLFAIASQGESLSVEQLFAQAWDEPYREPSSVQRMRMEVLRLQMTLAAVGLTIERTAEGRYVLGGGLSVLRWGPAEQTQTPEQAKALPTNLLVEPNLFVGRLDDLATLGRLMEEGRRLVTVLGPPGTGKTRFTKRFGWLCLEDKTVEAVWFCDLTEAQTEQDVLLAVARVLKMRPDTAKEGMERLVERIGGELDRRGRVLLILDNAEQVVEGLEAPLLDWWERAPQVQFLVTSRLPLRLTMEQRMPLAPLAVPADGQTFEGSEDHPAVALFVERARIVQPDFALHAGNVQAVFQLVRELDGLPLAIELAAARAQMWSPEMQLAQISMRFRMLVKPGSSDSRRQATLRGALDWSWELLHPWEQAALAQCSVFREGFDWHAVEAVVDLSAFPAAPWPVDVVQSLLEHSLLVVTQTASGARLSMLLSVMAYAEEKLTAMGSLEAERAERRHAAHFAMYGTEGYLRSINQVGGPARFARIRGELANFVVANERSLSMGWTEEAGRCCQAAARIIDVTGPYAQGLKLVDDTLAVVSSECENFFLLMNARGNFLNSMGRLEEARECFSAYIAMAEEAGNVREVGHGLAALLTTLNSLRLYELSASTGKRALEIFRQLGEPLDEATVLVNLGVMDRGRGFDGRAVGFYEMALERYRAAGEFSKMSVVLGNLGNTHIDGDRLEDAERCYAEALDLRRKMSDKPGEARLLLSLGYVKRLKGHSVEAVELWEKALPVLEEAGQRFWQAQFYINLGNLHRAEGRLDVAESCHRKGLALSVEVGDRRSQATHLCALGLICTAAGRLEQALTWLEDGLEVAKTMEQKYHFARMHNAIGDLALKTDNFARARKYYELARELHRDSQHRPNFVRVLINLGSLCEREGDEEQAVAHWMTAIQSLAQIERRVYVRNLLRDIQELQDRIRPELWERLQGQIDEVAESYSKPKGS